MTQEELASLQIHQAMLMRSDQEVEQVINEALPEEEEGESQDVNQPRKQNSYKQSKQKNQDDQHAAYAANGAHNDENGV